jgi:hypothetical protein
LAVKPRSAIKLKQDPTHLIHKRSLQLHVSLAYYVDSYHPKFRQAFKYKHTFQYNNITSKAIKSIQDNMMHARSTHPHKQK